MTLGPCLGGPQDITAPFDLNEKQVQFIQAVVSYLHNTFSYLVNSRHLFGITSFHHSVALEFTDDYSRLGPLIAACDHHSATWGVSFMMAGLWTDKTVATVAILQLPRLWDWKVLCTSTNASKNFTVPKGSLMLTVSRSTVYFSGLGGI